MHLSAEQVHAFLIARYSKISDIRHLADGWWSQAFSFVCEEGRQVLRISAYQEDFLKDRFAFIHFNSSAVPVPAFKETSKLNEQLYYCFTAFCDGMPSDRLMDGLDAATAVSVAPLLLQPLLHVHNIDVSGYKGWGLTNGAGEGGWNSWPAYLHAMFSRKENISWQQLAHTSWLDGDLFQRLMNRMQALFTFLPKQKQLLHGDYGYDNLLTDAKGHVLAVLDWGEMRLGDALYDLLHLNEPWRAENDKVQYLPIWKALWENQGHTLLHFEQRLECYRIHYTLFHLYMHIVRGEQQEYTAIAEWAATHL